MPAKEPSVLLLHGEESFLAGEESGRVLRAWREGLVSDFGFEALDASGVTMERLRDAILQAPFLDPWRVVSVRGVATRKADGLAPALAEVPESTRVLLTVSGRLPAASKLVKAVAALPGGQVRELAPLKGRGLTEWVAQRTRDHSLPAAVGGAVLRATRPDLGVIDSELRKLAAYRATGAELDSAAIADLLAGGRQEEVFRLTDLLLPRPAAGAWKVLDSLLEREGATLISYRLARHLALVLEVRTRQDRGEPLGQIQAELREHSFVVQKAFDAARSTPPERLEKGLRALLDYEWEVKSGQVDAEYGLKAALAKL